MSVWTPIGSKGNRLRNLLSALLFSSLTLSGLFSQTSAPFEAPSSAGKQIEDAARASVQDRSPVRPQVMGPGLVEILSETQGVDFGPYLRVVLSEVHTNWYKSIPQEDRTLSDNVIIQFEILKNGKVANIKLAEPSGVVDLDRAAWSAVSVASPFPPLPSEFSGPSLRLRCRFLFNPTSSDLAGLETSNQPAPVMFPTTHARLVKPLNRRNFPKYPKKAIKRRIEGTVRLQVLVDRNGTVTGFPSVEGDEMLVAAATKAVGKWEFHPAEENGAAVKEEVPIEIDFHAEGKVVRARLIWPGAPKPIELIAVH